MDYGNLIALVEGAVPYARKTGVRVESLERGRAVLRLPDDESNLNHVATQHAGALFTLGETCGGAAMMSFHEMQSLVLLIKKAEIAYLRRAKGLVTATCVVPEDLISGVLATLETEGKTNADVLVTLHDADGQAVAEFRPTYHFRKAL